MPEMWNHNNKKQTEGRLKILNSRLRVGKLNSPRLQDEGFKGSIEIYLAGGALVFAKSG
jgi:hypothetical protein